MNVLSMTNGSLECTYGKNTLSWSDILRDIWLLRDRDMVLKILSLFVAYTFLSVDYNNMTNKML